MQQRVAVLFVIQMLKHRPLAQTLDQSVHVAHRTHLRQVLLAPARKVGAPAEVGDEFASPEERYILTTCRVCAVAFLEESTTRKQQFSLQ